MDIHELIVFKNWADEIYLSYMEDLTEKQFAESIPTINKSAKLILFHIYAVYWSWYHRITDRNYSDEPELEESSKSDIIEGIKGFNQKFLEYIENEGFNNTITIQWRKEDRPVETTAENVLFNYVTHSAYHRGQIALILKYHGIKEIKETDFNPYIYEKGQE